jgi:tetratricopeptide (TPR) repeat protein
VSFWKKWFHKEPKKQAAFVSEKNDEPEQPVESIAEPAVKADKIPESHENTENKKVLPKRKTTEISNPDAIWRAQPIFISSTFTDMMAERDALRDFVFKELEEKLAERRIRLEPIDLRWGVETTSEKEKEQKELLVLKVCLDEIDRCQPFFIGIIGDRYGWIPPKKRLLDAENEKGFTSKLENKSVTALEIEYGALASKEQLRRSFFFFREPLPYEDMPKEIRSAYSDRHNPELQPEVAQKRLDDFKALIIKTIGKERVFTYKANWDGKKVVGLEDFKSKVTAVLWQELDEATKELETVRPKTWQEEERRYLQDFIEDRTVSFNGRGDIIQKLKQFALSKSGSDNWGLCLTGESGLGKSSLFSKLYKELKKENVLLLAHAAGISLRSDSLTNMLTIWIEELAAFLKIDIREELQQKTKFEDLTKLCSELLSRAALQKRVVVLADALNQFERTAHAKYVNWLPELIPANAAFVFTAIAGEETENLSKRKGVKIENVQPVSRSDAEKIIALLCARYHKTLNAKAIEKLLSKKKADGTFAYSNPLWLTMAIDEFLLLDEDDFALMKGLQGNAEQKLEQLLLLSAEKMPADIQEMYQYVFQRCTIFGEEFVSAVLRYIGISRHGLRESDLEELINRFTGTRWQNLNFASLRRYLRNHLVRKGELGLWDFRHMQVRESLQKGILAAEDKVVTLHKNISEYLDSLSEDDPLRLSEVIWHLFKCKDPEKAATIYAGNWSDSALTHKYSVTLKDILLAYDDNTDWVASLMNAQEVMNERKRYLFSNFHFSLAGMIKDNLILSRQLKLFQKIHNHASELRKRNPDSAEYAKDLSVSYDRIGDIYKALGDTKSALTSYESSLKIREELRKRNPESVDYSRGLSVSYERIGDIYTDLGDTKSALTSFESLLKIREELRKRNPDSTDYARGLSVSYERIGDIYTDLGDTKTGFDCYQNAFQIAKDLSAKDPSSSLYLQDLGRYYGRIGDSYKALDDAKSALASYESSLKIAKELRKRNPESADYARGLSVSYERIGDIYTSLDDTKTGFDCYQNAFQIAKDLSAKDPSSSLYLQDLGRCYERIGNIYTALGDYKTALTSYKSSLKIAEELRKLNPDSAEYARDLSVSYSRVGNIYTALGVTKSALTSYESSLKIAEELCKRNPDSGEYARDLVVSYAKLQKTDELKKALLYMKQKNMYMDPPLIQLSKHLGVE